MNLEVTVTRDYLSPVLADLAQRRGNIQEIQSRQDSNVVTGFVPLAEIMVGPLRLNLHILHKLLEKSQGSYQHRCGCGGGLPSPAQSLRWALPKYVISLNDRFSILSTYLRLLLLAPSQFFLPLFSPPASPALGQASECQQSLLPDVGAGEYF